MMAKLDAAQWREASVLLDELLELPPEAREQRLATLREAEPVLADTVLRLLAAGDAADAEGFLAGSAADIAPHSLAGQAVGAWRLVRPLGEGGMGVVWLARRDDGRFEAHAAVKFVALAMASAHARERFAREARILARLTHPNIARMLDAGVTTTGQPYLILEYVEGERIDAWCDAHRLDVPARLRLFLDVIAAVGHAHRNLVLHRDLKPSNILVGAEHTVKLLDFGIARLMGDERPDITQAAGRVFTPEYAAPEQVQGEAVSTAADVYALGVLLYGLLTGRHPTSQPAAAPVERLQAVVHRMPPRMSAVVVDADAPQRGCATARTLRRVLEGDLDTIVAKALHKQPEARYASVDALADDLRRHLAREPVLARPPTLAYRASRFARRNGPAVVLGSVAAIALLAGIAGTWTQARRATAEAREAHAQSARADAAARSAGEQLRFALRQLSLADAVNDLDAFLLADAAPGGKPLAVGELLARAERVVGRSRGGDEANRVALLTAIGSQYQALDRHERAQDVLHRAYDASRNLADVSARVAAACAYAESIGASGQYAEADRLIRSALSELPNAPQYVRDRLACHWRAAQIASDRDDGATAVAEASAAERLLHALPIASPSWELRVLMTLGESYRVARRNEAAIAAFEQADARLRTLGREDTETASTLYNNWAMALYAAGRPLEAAALFERAIANSTTGNGGDVSPMLMLNYARTAARLDRYDAAREWAVRADARARAMGNRIVVDQGYLVRAGNDLHAGRYDEAEALLDTAARRYAEVLPPGHPAFAGLTLERARVAQARGEPARALSLATEALHALQAVAPRDRFLGEIYRRRAMMYLAQQRLAEAHDDATRALALERAAAGDAAASANAGTRELVLARVLEALGDAASARAAATRAAAQLEPTLGPAHALTREAYALAGHSVGGASSAR
jgi:serine/threonine-protein kinase